MARLFPNQPTLRGPHLTKGNGSCWPNEVVSPFNEATKKPIKDMEGMSHRRRKLEGKENK